MNIVEVTDCRNIIVSDSHIINVLSNINSFSYIVIGYWIWTSELNYTKRPQSTVYCVVNALYVGTLGKVSCLSLWSDSSDSRYCELPS